MNNRLKITWSLGVIIELTVKKFFKKTTIVITTYY